MGSGAWVSSSAGRPKAGDLLSGRSAGLAFRFLRGGGHRVGSHEPIPEAEIELVIPVEARMAIAVMGRRNELAPGVTVMSGKSAITAARWTSAGSSQAVGAASAGSNANDAKGVGWRER